MIDIFLILLITAFAVYCSSESYDKNFKNFFYWLERTKVPLVFINMIKIIVIPIAFLLPYIGVIWIAVVLGMFVFHYLWLPLKSFFGIY